MFTDSGTTSVKCQLSDYVFLRRVPRRTIIAKTSNLHQKVGYRQDYKYRKLHAYTPKTLTVVLSLVPTRKNQLSATGVTGHGLRPGSFSGGDSTLRVESPPEKAL